MEAITNFMGNGGIYLSIALLAIAIATSVLFSLANLFSDFEGSKKALLGIVGLAVLVIIGFALASSELPAFAAEKGISPRQYKMVGGVINTAVIATALIAVYLVIDIILGIIRN